MQLKSTPVTLVITCLFIAATITTGCGSSGYLQKDVRFGEWTVEYSLFKNPPRKHNKYTIGVFALSGKRKIGYWFYEDSDFVMKRELRGEYAGLAWYMVYDSSYNYVSDKCIVKNAEASEKINGIVTPLTELDITVMNRVKSICDSMKLKDFSALKRARGFKVSSESKKK